MNWFLLFCIFVLTNAAPNLFEREKKGEELDLVTGWVNPTTLGGEDGTTASEMWPFSQTSEAATETGTPGPTELLPTTVESMTVQPTFPQTTQNSGPTSCYALIFAGEMSQAITAQQKTDFFNVILQIAANFQETNLQFAITTFGSGIYQYLNEFQGYNDFVATVNALMSQSYPSTNIPNIAPVLDEIYDDLILYPTKGVSVLFMGEMEAIRDPNAGYTAALRVAGTGKNVYVLDFSKGVLTNTLWPYLTNNHYERIINGTGSDGVDSIYSAFYNTLVSDINNNIC